MSWRPHASLDAICERARLYRLIRNFFTARGCLEVDTPLLQPATATDVNVESLELAGGRREFLQTSPEFAMKRLLAAGSGSIFQICHAFRGSEQGRRHNPEFTLLEWYREGYDYRQLMDEIELLITSLSRHHCRFSRVSYRRVFAASLDIDVEAVGLDELRAQCRARVPGTDSGGFDRDQCLDLLLAVAIAPGLRDYLFVYDYPLSQAALARRCAGNDGYAERFELFFDGIELANGFSELTDAAEQRRRFEQDLERRRELGLPAYPIDENLLAALESGLEDCAGVALGLDRLLMVLLGLESIDEVLTFRD